MTPQDWVLAAAAAGLCAGIFLMLLAGVGGLAFYDWRHRNAVLNVRGLLIRKRTAKRWPL